MARSQPATSDLKRQLVVELDRARLALAHQTQLAQTHLSPAALVQRSVQKHKVAWIITGVVAGAVVVRMLLPPKFRSDKSSQSDKKRGVSGILRNIVFTVAQRAAMNFAKEHFQDQARSYLDSLLNRQGPDRTTHVPNR
jgi:hypothetical protein